MQIRKLWRYARLARQQTGKSSVCQLSELARLSRGVQKLGVEEYYELGIFNDDYFPPDSKSRCVGWRASGKIDTALNEDHWRATANDKILNYAMLAQYGFPIPETIANYSPTGRRIGNERVIANPRELRAYLFGELKLPVFIKPVHGGYGRGTFSLRGIGPDPDTFIDVLGRTVALDEVLSVCQTPENKGALFQTRLRQHDAVRALAGETVSCVRIIVVCGAQGPALHLAFWKIARGHNITDNFCMGDTGNLLAALDLDTGRVTRVVTGLWPDGTEIDDHPDTGARLLGACLPDWQQATDLCLAAAKHFPGLRLQHWDIAFSDRGPVLMELNTEADLSVPQYLGRSPFLDAALIELLAAPR